ncbi:MAG: acetyl-CoA hydrolase/transferase C-terminal domain-containing protein [Myxococcota bacterium]|nr:acetyl-CoA hydrolase/transferase C-terminal domain-containing protein [Myxococcota bacterium]
MSPLEAAALFRPDDTLVVGVAGAQPPALLHALGERDDWQDFTVFASLLIEPFAVFTRKGVRLRTGFQGGVERALRAAGHAVDFIPSDFRRFGPVARSLKPRIVATSAAAGLRPGEVSLAIHAGGLVSEFKNAAADPDRLLIVEVNAQLPSTHGLPPDHTHSIALDEIDVLIEVDRPPFTIATPEPSEVERRIADFALGYVETGATLQTGIGGVPDQVVSQLASSNRGPFGIHTEMFTTGLMQLHEAGKVDDSAGLYGPFSVATFSAGTPELYSWLDDNPLVRFLPVELTNTPNVIAQHSKMISINGALTVDLGGQIAADTIGSRQFSGVGGHEDFTAGASMSEHGHSLICLPSTANVEGKSISRIATSFPAGTTVTSPRHQVDVIITEWGAAELAGKTVSERADALIEIAHPDHRDELRVNNPFE